MPLTPEQDQKGPRLLRAWLTEAGQGPERAQLLWDRFNDNQKQLLFARINEDIRAFFNSQLALMTQKRDEETEEP